MHWSRPKPNSSQGGWVIDSYLHEILLITPLVLANGFPIAYNLTFAAEKVAAAAGQETVPHCMSYFGMQCHIAKWISGLVY